MVQPRNLFTVGIVLAGAAEQAGLSAVQMAVSHRTVSSSAPCAPGAVGGGAHASVGEAGKIRMNEINRTLLLLRLCSYDRRKCSGTGPNRAGRACQVEARVRLGTSRGPAWYRNQRNSRGGFCCDQADGDAYYGNYRLNADGSVTLADGTHIPKWQVLSGNNPTGHAVWWHYKNVMSYCFSPGPLI